MNRPIVALAVSLLAFLAAAPLRAQIVIDGTRDAGYLATRWVQGVPTSAGDNSQAGVPAPGNPESVTTGAEFKIPLSALGNPYLTAHFRLAGLIVSSDYTQASNQAVGSLLCNAMPLGPTRAVRFDLLAGPTNNKQFVIITGGKNVTPPVIDGTLDAAYGGPLFLQAASAYSGDSTSGQLDYAPASEIDAVYFVRTLTDLYVFVAGNLATDQTRLVLFFDSKVSGGQNELRGDNGYYALNIMGDDGTGNGLRFDPELYADYALDFSGFDPDGPGPTPATFSVTYAEVLSFGGGRSFYCGSNSGGGVVGGDLSGGQSNAPALKATINNTNAVGVTTDRCDSVPSIDLAVGSELDNLLFTTDAGRLCLFLAGNLRTDGTILNIFIDHDAGQGQSVLRGDNPPGTGNILANMAGLTFDPEFSADYWVGVRAVRTASGYELWADAAVLRTGGPRKNLSGFPFDYTAFSGGPKNLTDPIFFDGPRIDAQTGAVPALYTQFGPSKAGDSCLADPLNPVGTPGLIAVALDNSNILGVGAFPSGGTLLAAMTATGIELAIDLGELGWDGNGRVRFAGFIADPTNTTMTNQVLGELPPSTGPFGPIAGVNFANVPDFQFVSTGCLSDINRDGFVNGDDYDLFAEAFDLGDPSADLNNDGFVNGDDYDLFAEAFEGGC